MNVVMQEATKQRGGRALPAAHRTNKMNETKTTEEGPATVGLSEAQQQMEAAMVEALLRARVLALDAFRLASGIAVGVCQVRAAARVVAYSSTAEDELAAGRLLEDDIRRIVMEDEGYDELIDDLMSFTLDEYDVQRSDEDVREFVSAILRRAPDISVDAPDQAAE